MMSLNQLKKDVETSRASLRDNPDSIERRLALYNAIGNYVLILGKKLMPGYCSKMLLLYEEALTVCDNPVERKKINGFLPLLRMGKKVTG